MKKGIHVERRGKRDRRNEASTQRMAVQRDYSKKSYSENPKRPKRGRSLHINVNEFTNFDSALRAFSSMTLNVVRDAKERRYYRPKLTRGSRKRRGKALEKRNKERGYVA